jgi:flavin reductase (DIM6/NTAB) family NADH-FMN oxidoreductase RutF
MRLRAAQEAKREGTVRIPAFSAPRHRLINLIRAPHALRSVVSGGQHPNGGAGVTPPRGGIEQVPGADDRERGAVMTDPAAYRESVSRLASGLAVVATRDLRGKPVGLLLQAIFSLAVDPPRLLLSVGTGSRTLPSLLSQRLFSVNVLGGPGADRMQARFASTADDKFAGLPWQPAFLGAGAGAEAAGMPGGVPVLTSGVTATLICRLEEHLTRHDHTLLIAEPLVVQAGASDGGEPLIYYRHQFVPLRQPQVPV